MGTQGAENQAADFVPPRQAAIIAITLDNTSREKNLYSLSLGQFNGLGTTDGGTMYLTLRANVKWWFKLAPATGTTCDETVADAAATAPNTYQANACIEVAADEFIQLRIDRGPDKYLVVKGSGAGILRGWVSSTAYRVPIVP